MSFLSVEDLDRLIYALLIRAPLSEEERRALILELVAHRRLHGPVVTDAGCY